MASAVYRLIVNTVDRRVPNKLRPFWEHQAGPKTVFFWAPAMKWVCVLCFDSFIFNFCFLRVWSLPVYRISVVRLRKYPLLKLVIWNYFFCLHFTKSENFLIKTASLAATGMIWSRYSLVIIPKNMSLFAVNMLVAATNLYQLGRIYVFKQ